MVSKKQKQQKKERGQVDKLICQSGILRSTCTFYVKWKKPAEASSLIFARQINFLSVLLGKVEKDFFVCAKTSKTNKQKNLTSVFIILSVYINASAVLKLHNLLYKVS